ncbi:uncharacterized protein PHACADRAFT_214046 [Phanerochaete carnosa HHB-10118-sp]|uniref:Uncharacterized protein n=1 Tax=Phanerochaete carnosa (strain HHB-10118-sp) TaxID=650164 RepID=K5VUW1_PHACS|nr:uncharacterized protein PHACADRAFT_214046 [Phanerochaete carnosa HHB-10118-sp]EKM50349.1 hypothetical protein PHACADRAFT_214046 [Phanerochaete carnosa HHB-10118-sp]
MAIVALFVGIGVPSDVHGEDSQLAFPTAGLVTSTDAKDSPFQDLLSVATCASYGTASQAGISEVAYMPARNRESGTRNAATVTTTAGHPWSLAEKLDAGIDRFEGNTVGVGRGSSGQPAVNVNREIVRISAVLIQSS